MNDTLQMALTIIGSVIASSGFWAYITKRNDKKDLKARMLTGLAHDRIIELGMVYITRGWITNDEYENLVDYLYKPYHDLGGNGAAERIVNEVKKLEIRGINIHENE